MKSEIDYWQETSPPLNFQSNLEPIKSFSFSVTKWPGCEAYYSTLLNAEIRNIWNYTSTTVLS
jgi:hypothetical protein